MGRSVQKKIKFSKGQVSEKLVERTDLELFNSSAQELKNFVSNIYGGINSRQGTDYLDTISITRSTGDVLFSLGGEQSNLQNLETFTSSNIGTARELFRIDYNVVTEGTIEIKNIKLLDKLQIHESVSNGAYTVPKGRELFVEAVGGGGGGANDAGCAGAAIKAYFIAQDDEELNYVIGAGGRGSYAYVRNGRGEAGKATTITSDYMSVSCGGGGGRNGRRSGGGSTGVGTLSYSIQNLVSVSERSVDREQTQYSLLNPYGNGGRNQPNDEGAGYAGSAGYISLSVGYVKVDLYVSDDNVNWTFIGTKNVTTNESDITATSTVPFRYIKGVLDEDTGYNFVGNISLQWVLLTNATVVLPSNLKLKSFIYNNEQKYLLLLGNEVINIYENGVKVFELEAPDLLDSYLQDIKITYKDDIAIFTHKEMRTKELKRTAIGWEWSDFEYKNVPFYAFDGEIETIQTIGITPSSTEGSLKITASSALFNADSVGQLIDGNGGRVRITEYVSSTVVNGVTQIPFYTTDKITSWKLISGYEEVWSSNRGFPTTCLFSNQRLWFGGSRSLPATVWASRVGDYNNFKNAGNYDNDSIDVSLLTNNEIIHMVENRGIHILTTGEEYSASESALTPDGFSVFKNTSNGSLKGVEPILLSGTVLFVERTGKSLQKYVYDYNQASYITDNLSIFSNIINKPIAMDIQVNSDDSSGDYVYMALDDGTMLVACVVLSQNIFSMSKFVTNGNIIDVCCLLEETYVLVDRNGNISLERLSEKATDMSVEAFVNGNEISQLEQFTGYEVYVYNDEFAEKVNVASGIVELTQPLVGNVKVGLTYDYSVQSNPIAINNQTNTVKKRISKAAVLCEGTKRITFNGQSKGDSDKYSFYSCSKYDYDVRFNIAGEFYPINILSVTLTLNYED